MARRRNRRNTRRKKYTSYRKPVRYDTTFYRRKPLTRSRRMRRLRRVDALESRKRPSKRSYTLRPATNINKLKNSRKSHFREATRMFNTPYYKGLMEEPRKHSVCHSRKIRRRIIFSTRKSGKSGQKRPVFRNPGITCRRK